MQIANVLSICIGPEIDPNAAKQVTIPVYGKNKIPTLIRNLLEPNLGTNHSEVLSFDNDIVWTLLLILSQKMGSC